MQDTKLKEEFGIVWTEFNKRDQLVGKKRVFKTERARSSFVNKLEVKDTFNRLEAWLN